MSENKDLKFAKSHEWVRLEGDTAYIGISDHAQESLGDIVFVELPEPDTQITAGDEATNIESVKAASDIYAPISGEVVAVNEDLEDSPELVNSDSYGDGWMFKIKADDAAEFEKLLDADAYESSLDEE